MNKKIKNTALKELTEKYFIEQKEREIGIGIIVLVGIMYLPFIVGKGVFLLVGNKVSHQLISSILNISQSSFPISSFEVWQVGIAIIILLLILGVFLGAICVIIKYWIESNWEKADERAREILNEN